MLPIEDAHTTDIFTSYKIHGIGTELWKLH